MRDLIAEVEEMLKPANIPIRLHHDGHELALEEAMMQMLPPGEFKLAIGLSPFQDSGALCSECPHMEGCLHVCQFEWEESNGED